jgi:hypothetical protein
MAEKKKVVLDISGRPGTMRGLCIAANACTNEHRKPEALERQSLPAPWRRNTWRRNGTKLSCRNLAEIYFPEFSSNFVGWRCINCVRDFPCRKDTRAHFDERN